MGAGAGGIGRGKRGGEGGTRGFGRAEVCGAGVAGGEKGEGVVERGVGEGCGGCEGTGSG